MKNNLFKPFDSQDVIHSSNPKTRSNRENLLAKTDLELSNVRDDAAFRTAKSRALKKLQKSRGYRAMSSEEKEAAEQHIIDELEIKREVKKRQHAEEWTARVYDELIMVLIIV